MFPASGPVQHYLDHRSVGVRREQLRSASGSVPSPASRALLISAADERAITRCVGAGVLFRLRPVRPCATPQGSARVERGERRRAQGGAREGCVSVCVRERGRDCVRVRVRVRVREGGRE